MAPASVARGFRRRVAPLCTRSAHREPRSGLPRGAEAGQNRPCADDCGDHRPSLRRSRVGPRATPLRAAPRHWSRPLRFHRSTSRLQSEREIDTLPERLRKLAADVDLRRETPILLTTMYIHPAPQDAALASMWSTGAIARFWHIGSGLSRILDLDFAEFSFPRTRVNKTKRGGVN